MHSFIQGAWEDTVFTLTRVREAAQTHKIAAVSGRVLLTGQRLAYEIKIYGQKCRFEAQLCSQIRRISKARGLWRAACAQPRKHKHHSSPPDYIPLTNQRAPDRTKCDFTLSRNSARLSCAVKSISNTRAAWRVNCNAAISPVVLLISCMRQTSFSCDAAGRLQRRLRVLG